jgi:hypothetical protein
MRDEDHVSFQRVEGSPDRSRLSCHLGRADRWCCGTVVGNIPTSSVSGNDALAAAALRQAVQATMGSPSFTILISEIDVSLDEGSNVTARAVYQVPDRYELTQNLPVPQAGIYITIGTSTYSRANGSPTYTKSQTLRGQTA